MARLVRQSEGYNAGSYPTFSRARTLFSRRITVNENTDQEVVDAGDERSRSGGLPRDNMGAEAAKVRSQSAPVGESRRTDSVSSPSEVDDPFDGDAQRTLPLEVQDEVIVESEMRVESTGFPPVVTSPAIPDSGLTDITARTASTRSEDEYAYLLDLMRETCRTFEIEVDLDQVPSAVEPSVLSTMLKAILEKQPQSHGVTDGGWKNRYISKTPSDPESQAFWVKSSPALHSTRMENQIPRPSTYVPPLNTPTPDTATTPHFDTKHSARPPVQLPPMPLSLDESPVQAPPSSLDTGSLRRPKLPDRPSGTVALSHPLQQSSFAKPQSNEGFRDSTGSSGFLRSDSGQPPNYSISIGSDQSVVDSYWTFNPFAHLDIRLSDYKEVYTEGDPTHRNGLCLKIAAGDMYRDRNIQDDWQFFDVLGEGSTGKVWRAESREEPGLFAAIKCMKKIHVAVSSISRAVFNHRVISSAQGHPNIVRVYYVYEDAEKFYLVMEFLSGGHLLDRIAPGVQYTERDCAHVLRDMISAVSFLHRHRITHRDIKPENFVYSDDSPTAKLKLTDFGISYCTESNEDLMRTLTGTPQYIAPEVVLRQKYSTAVDMWSIGVTAYLLLVGHNPFDEGSMLDIVNRLKYDAVPFDGPEWLSVSEPAKKFVMKLLLRDPKKRLTAEDALKDPWLTGEITSDSALESVQQKIATYMVKQKWRTLVNAALAQNRMQSLLQEAVTNSERHLEVTQIGSPVEPGNVPPVIGKSQETKPSPGTRRVSIREPPKSTEPRRKNLEKPTGCSCSVM